jgi:uncharacterized caspase-like protein
MPGALRAAIVIGNNAYLEGPLDNPVRDAGAIDARLKELNFDTVFAQDLSRESTFAAMDEFRSRFPAAEAALLFFAGHGMQRQTKNYLVPVEARIRHMADVDRYGIDVDRFLDLFDEMAATSIAFLDCCRNNPFLDQILANTKAEHRDLLPARPGMTSVTARNGTLIAYAASPNRTADDGAGNHSPFTQALLSRLGRPNESILDMLIDVTNEVLELTNNQQCPWCQHSLRRKFVFNPQEAEPAPNRASGPEGDQAAWLAISASNSLSVLEGFIREYPDSRYGDYARLRVSQIKAVNEAQQALAAAGLSDTARVTVTTIRPYDRVRGTTSAPAYPTKKSDSLGYRNTVDPAFLEGLVAISLYSVAKVTGTRGRAYATAFFVSGIDLFGPADRGLYALTAAHAVGRTDPSGFALDPSEALISFEAMSERAPGIASLPVADIVWESGPWDAGCDVTVLSFGPDLPDFVRPIPIAAGLPAIDAASPLSFDSRPRVVSVSYPYGGALRFGTVDNYLLDYERPIFDEQGKPVDKVIRLHHTAASEPGSSGCPILNEDLEVIGLHLGGGDGIPRLNGLDGRYSANFAVWIQSAIREARP